MIKISLHPRIFYLASQEMLDLALADIKRLEPYTSSKMRYLTQYSHVVLNVETNVIEKCGLTLEQLMDDAFGNPAAHTLELTLQAAPKQVSEVSHDS